MPFFLTQQKRVVVTLSVLFSLLLGAHFNTALAQNMGVEGSVYTIVEPDLLTSIHQKLTFLQASGVLARENNAVIRRTLQHIIRPTPVSGVTDLPMGKKPRVRYFDPTIVLNNDIKTTHGDIIATKGTRINPLDYRDFKETLLFINGDNAAQVHWAKQRIKQYAQQQKRFKLILVNGDINAVANALQHRIYFDQHGSLCHYFHIRHTPTLAYQSKNRLRHHNVLTVQEVPVG